MRVRLRAAVGGYVEVSERKIKGIYCKCGCVISAARGNATPPPKWGKIAVEK